MRSSTAGLGIVLALAVRAVFAQELVDSRDPPSEPGSEQRDAGRQYRQAQIDLYDALRGDSSPQVQVLAARVYFPDDGNSEMGGALRPKREDVVSRAVQLAPDDAFVQWMAADSGSYGSNQCGPTRRPEAEVGNLVRLEPDNAGALLYAVALAHAKGDQTALDDALTRMAGAARASDHSGDEIALWRKVYQTVPAARRADAMLGDDDASSVPLAALRHAQQRSAFRFPSSDSAVEAACKPDAQSERSWQRLGWCADAARLLATKGESLALRELGLKLLSLSGNQDVADLQRQYEWLKANSANPYANSNAFLDAPDATLADWRGAPHEIAATERRLERLGRPLAVPAGWNRADTTEGKDEAANDAAENAWQSYVSELLEDMRGSADVRSRASALSARKRLVGPIGVQPADAQAKASVSDELSELAAANPDDVLVQWLAASSGNDSAGAALANLQRLDPDNAATWTLALAAADADAKAILWRMASAKRYTEHLGEMMTPWLTAVRKRPPPADMVASFSELAVSSSAMPSAESLGAMIAFMTAMPGSTGASSLAPLYRACSGKAEDTSPLREDCIAAARLLLDSGNTLIAAQVGERLLRKVDAFGPADRERARHLAWWQSQLRDLEDSSEFEAYLTDFLTTGSEIEALRLAAARASKAEPPADWQSNTENEAAEGN